MVSLHFLLLYLREIHSGSDFEDDYYNEDHGSEGSNDDADDKRHCGRHSPLGLHLLLVPNLLFISDGVLRDLVHIVLLVVSLLGALLGRVVADGLPMVVWVSSVGKVVKICSTSPGREWRRGGGRCEN